MTDHDDDPDRTWFRAAVDPTLDAHPVADRWADVERRSGQEPPLVVSLVPRPPRRRNWWVLAAAVATVVLVMGGVALGVVRNDEADRTAATTAPTSSVAPPSTTPSTPSTETPTTTTTTTTTSVPPGPLVEVPEVQRRIDLASFGLDVRYLDRATTTVPEGDVVSQDPAPGTPVPEGSLVVVIMSGGGPVTSWPQIPDEARAFTGTLPGYRTTEPIRLVRTSVGEAYKVDAWLYGPCAAVDEAARVLLDPSYDARCY